MQIDKLKQDAVDIIIDKVIANCELSLDSQSLLNDCIRDGIKEGFMLGYKSCYNIYSHKLLEQSFEILTLQHILNQRNKVPNMNKVIEH